MQNTTQKEKALYATIRRRFHGGIGRDCVALLDRLRFVCDDDPTTNLRKLSDFSAGQNIFLRTAVDSFQPYGRAQWFSSKHSGTKFCIESEQRHGWLAPASVTLIADDRTGLLPAEVLPVAGAIKTPTLAMAEEALDFSPLSGVDRQFVRRHGLFGKLHRDLETENPVGDWWGSRRGAKRVKSYTKDTVGGHRVELVARGRFLRRHGISSVGDLAKLASILPVRHVWFARLDEERLTKRLRENGASGRETIAALRQVHELEGDLGMVLDYLRGPLGLTNTRRLLVGLRANKLVREALREWGRQWRMR
jgi:hypothetical protein